MGLRDRLNELFGRNKKAKETQQPPIVNNRRNNAMNFRTLQRRDGTSIDIMPVLDTLGGQECKPVYNNRTHQGQHIAKFIICSPEVERLGKGNFTTILIDINKELLDSPEGADWIANGLLSSQRIEKVINEYNGYAGGLVRNENGQITGKYVDQGIIEWLGMDAQEKSKKYQKEQTLRDEQYKAKIKADAAKRGVNIKTSHAEDLSLL